MKIEEREREDLMEEFERIYHDKVPSIDLEPKRLWDKGYVYKNGKANEIFLAFRSGYELGKACTSFTATPNLLGMKKVRGSGTTGVACKNLGRHFIGIELDKGYFNIATERINATD